MMRNPVRTAWLVGPALAITLFGLPARGDDWPQWMGPNRDLTDFSHVQVDRAAEIATWAGVLRDLRVDVYGYVNNHFAGHSPASARDLQRRLGLAAVDPRQIGDQISLF